MTAIAKAREIFAALLDRATPPIPVSPHLCSRCPALVAFVSRSQNRRRKTDGHFTCRCGGRLIMAWLADVNDGSLGCEAREARAAWRADAGGAP